MMDKALRQAVANAKSAIADPIDVCVECTTRGDCTCDCIEELGDVVETSRIDTADLDLIVRALEERDKLLENYQSRPVTPGPVVLKQEVLGI